MVNMLCKHEQRKRLRSRPGYVQCLDCGKEFIPRGSNTRHGTYRGYHRHQRQRSGYWPWPPCEACAEAAAQRRRDYATTPKAREAHQVRARARAAALARLRRQHPGLYAAIYCDELAVRGTIATRQQLYVPEWEDVLARLIKAATGRDEASLQDAVRFRAASHAEREIAAQVRQLRVILSAAHQKGTEDD